jgi:hypothetical protein
MRTGGQDREVAEKAKILSVHIDTCAQSVGLVRVPGHVQRTEIVLQRISVRNEVERRK